MATKQVHAPRQADHRQVERDTVRPEHTLTDSMDEILDSIDEALEENALEVVRKFVCKGGE